MPNKNKIRKLLGFSIFLFVMLFAMLLICETADARAGGGHSYSGGGSSGGSGGGGSILDLIRLVYWLVRLCIECPIVGIPLTLLIIGIGIYVYKTGDNYVVDTTIRKGTNLYPSVAGTASLRKIKLKDPAFNESDFYHRAENAFRMVQESWSKRDLTNVEAFLADGTYEQFLIQINLLKEKHLIDVMENLKIKTTTILGYESDNNFDTIYLAITASAKNYRADDKTKKYVEGDRFEEDFAEVWTFLRRTGVKTLKKPGLLEGFCPNCGNKITIGRHAKCDSCGSILRSGEHDWVLSNITQACEWSERGNTSIPGVKRYIQHDPGFNVQHIEDLVSVMYWRKNESERLSDPTPLRKIATNEYCDSQTNFYRPDIEGNRKFFADCAVGSIRLMGVDNVTSDKEDYLFAKVIWSGIPAKRSSNGKITNVVNVKQNIKEVFVLKRKHGVKTDTKTSLCSSHCPNCGAATTDYLSNECEYCGTVLNDGTRDWVLDNVLPQNDSRITKAITLIKNEDNSSYNMYGGVNSGSRANVSENTSINKKNYTIDDYSSSMNSISGMTMIKWTIAMMLADGIIDPKEQEVIYEIGLRRGIGKSQIDNLVEEIKHQSSPLEYVAETTDLPFDNELVRMLIRVAFADGKIAKEEIEMLKYVGRRINMTDEQIKRLLMEERMRLYKMSKAVIKESKNM